MLNGRNHNNFAHVDQVYTTVSDYVCRLQTEPLMSTQGQIPVSLNRLFIAP